MLTRSFVEKSFVEKVALNCPALDHLFKRRCEPLSCALLNGGKYFLKILSRISLEIAH
jgi:hypothetical protein